MDNIKISKVGNVKLMDRFGEHSTGNLLLSPTDLMFASDIKETFIPLSSIDVIERGSLSAAGSSLTIRTRTFHSMVFLIPNDKEWTIEDVYAFEYTPPRCIEKSEGWNMFPLEDDFKRQNLPADLWLSSNFNQDYQYCDTYPRLLYVPASAPTQILIGSSKFRSRGRLPTLAYYHGPSKASICRCSQPLSGFSARCEEDEKMMTHILKSNPNCSVLYVVDSRPQVNAMVNRAQGKGYEDEKNYTNIRFHFQNIENIHVMRNSLAKLIEASAYPNYNRTSIVSGRGSGMSGYLSGVESSGWLKHVKAVLESANFVADSVNRGISCVVHCSDGWDRTSQCVSLAAILLDPYYRTVRGFLALVERDWLAFGHKFNDRCGHTGQATGDASAEEPSESKSTSKEVSPVFTQFLDAVFQLMIQHPRAFEFTELFLLELHDCVHNCQFGTFLGNCVKEREDLRLSERTYSAWPHILALRKTYSNQFYQFRSPELFARVQHSGLELNAEWKKMQQLKLDLKPSSIKFWRGMYNRHENGVHPRESIRDAGAVVVEHLRLLNDHLSLLKERHAELQRKNKEKLIEAMGDSGLGQSSSESTGSSNGEGSSSSKKHPHQHSTLNTSNSPASLEPRKSLASLGMSASLTSFDLSATDVCSTHLSSVAVRWKSLREFRACNSCKYKFNPLQKKLHCYKCGLIYCNNCLDETDSLPGLPSLTNIPTCKGCNEADCSSVSAGENPRNLLQSPA